MSQPANLYAVSVGTSSTVGLVPHVDTRDPASTDADVAKYPIGKEWVNSSSNNVWFLTSYSSPRGVLTANWVAAGGGALELSSLTGDTGTAVPSSGNIKIAGTTSQITTAASGSTVTLSVPSAFVAPGSVASTTSMTAGTTLTATLGNITATNGNLSLATAGNKIVIATGTNASVGTSGVMSGTPGAVTVATTACSTTAKVFFSRNVTGGTPGQVSITAQDATGFTLTSTGNETSTFNWWIINA